MESWMPQTKRFTRQRLAHADQFIQMLPNGYQTMLSGDGEELSQGQRQLCPLPGQQWQIRLYRFLTRPPSIDTRTESIVPKGMDNLMKGRTVFVIAQTFHNANSNAIIVLDHGNIIEKEAIMRI